MIGLLADTDDLDMLKEAFKEMDKDNNGVLTHDEIKAAWDQFSQHFTDEECENIIKQCDLDGDGNLDYQEFLSAAIDHKKVLTRQNIEKAFKIFDQNGDGYIDADEFKFILPTHNLSHEEGSQKN